MDATSDPDAILAELATLGLRAVRVVTQMLEIEQAAPPGATEPRAPQPVFAQRMRDPTIYEL